MIKIDWLVIFQHQWGGFQDGDLREEAESKPPIVKSW
jgi:hypothetical protein